MREDGLIELVAGNTDGLRDDDATHSDNGDLGGTAADVDDHGAGGFLDGQVGADSGGHGLFDQVGLAGAGLDRGLKDGTLLDRRDTGGNADDNARTRGPRIALLGRLVDKVAKHGLGNIEVGDDAVLQGTNGHDVAGRTAEHALCLDTDREDALVVLVDGDNRRLANDDALATHGDKRICGAEVDGKIARIATEEHIHQRKQRNS